MSYRKEFSFAQPLAFSSFRNWRRLVRESGGVDPPFRARALMVTLISLATSPLRWAERMVSRTMNRDVKRLRSPIFILGHWRSGTTHLHNVMSRDPNLGYVTLFQTLAPESLWIGQRTLKPILARFLPHKRMMDNMELFMDGPQEEEYALANQSVHCFYHQWSFPRRARVFFDKYALLKSIDQTELAEWKALYHDILAQASSLMGGRRLLLKNPTNTGRIPALLELFPDAKFIFLHRDPYTVYRSTLHFYHKVMALTQLQSISEAEMKRNILDFYGEITNRYLEDKRLVPEGNRVEVRFESFEAEPLSEMKRLYETLSLPGYEQARPGFVAHIAAQSGYRKNRFELTPDEVDAVNRNWGFALDRWDYPRLIS